MQLDSFGYLDRPKIFVPISIPITTFRLGWKNDEKLTNSFGFIKSFGVFMLAMYTLKLVLYIEQKRLMCYLNLVFAIKSNMGVMVGEQIILWENNVKLKREKRMIM